MMHMLIYVPIHDLLYNTKSKLPEQQQNAF